MDKVDAFIDPKQLKNEFNLGRLDGLVSSPNRSNKVRVADSRKIAAILLETNIVELQRHLLTITVQNQVRVNQYRWTNLPSNQPGQTRSPARDRESGISTQDFPKRFNSLSATLPFNSFTLVPFSQKCLVHARSPSIYWRERQMANFFKIKSIHFAYARFSTSTLSRTMNAYQLRNKQTQLTIASETITLLTAHTARAAQERTRSSTIT